MPAPRQDTCVRGHLLDVVGVYERPDGLGRQCGICKHLWSMLQQRVVRSTIVLMRHRQRCRECRDDVCDVGDVLAARRRERVIAFNTFRANGRHP